METDPVGWEEEMGCWRGVGEGCLCNPKGEVKLTQDYMTVLFNQTSGERLKDYTVCTSTTPTLPCFPAL